MTADVTADTPSLLADRDFLRYVAARGLSVLGTITTLIALPVLVYRISDSASLTALVAALEAGPYLVFGLLAGALGDRWNRRTVMVTADLCGAVMLASVPVAHWLDVLTVPHILAVAFLGPTCATFFDGAVFGAIPTLVGRSRIGEANSYVWTVQNVAEVMVPSLVGLALAVLHPATLLAFDAATFLASALLLSGIRRPLQDDARVRAPLTVRHLASEIAEGLRYLWRHAGIRTMTIVGFTQCVAGGGFVSLMVVWADRQLDIGTEGLRFGIVYGSWAVGGILASLTLPRLLRRSTTPARITLLALPFSALMGVATPLWDAWWAGALSLFVWSIFYTLVVINSISYRQQVTPEPLLGRVNTAGRMLSWGLGWTGGAFLAGVLSRWLGLQGTLFAVTAVAFVGVAVAWTSPLVGAREPAVE
ncbi:MAG TPA: MFS transporter [Nocardioides sp.]|uniref:MFS transporter n=1 Tax=Nocardioides sp. TaxID=35761 RepID=UPI002D7ED307|nr:MFS transporter [Nocardioides sp.]HET6651979.1 MFS transporter [Nocardioides sp.]